ncbi:hypothetical protein C8R45DRAFT_1224469 [Mycena sanguinolenta]|nr:hypothetical protein C8R45DRAFT_1224469 [Mycena sanguinolenta]
MGFLNSRSAHDIYCSALTTSTGLPSMKMKTTMTIRCTADNLSSRCKTPNRFPHALIQPPTKPLVHCILRACPDPEQNSPGISARRIKYEQRAYLPARLPGVENHEPGGPYRAKRDRAPRTETSCP